MSSYLEDRIAELGFILDNESSSLKMREQLYQMYLTGDGLPSGLIQEYHDVRLELIKHLNNMHYFYGKRKQELEKQIKDYQND